MAITQTAIQGWSANWTTSTASSSQTPSSNALQVVAVNMSDDSGAPTVSGCGLTWVEIGNISFPASPTKRLTVFRALGASPSTGAITVSLPASTLVSVSWCEFAGVDTSGTNGSGAVVQSITGIESNATSPPYPLDLTLAAFGDAANGTFMCAGSSAGTTFSADTGFTLIHSVGASRAVGTSWRDDNDTSPAIIQTDGSWVDFGKLAFEIKDAGGGAPSATGKSNPLYGCFGGCLQGSIG